MNRNQKIGIGCGAAGCLGLLVVAVAGVAFYFWYESKPRQTNRNSNVNISSNRASNTDSSDTNSSNTASADNNSSDSSDNTPSSSMSDDDKHKLFQAAGMTGDNVLITKVLKHIGLGSETGSAYQDFVKEHAAWSLNNLDFVTSVSTPEKARAYVEAHLDD